MTTDALILPLAILTVALLTLVVALFTLRKSSLLAYQLASLDWKVATAADLKALDGKVAAAADLKALDGKVAAAAVVKALGQKVATAADVNALNKAIHDMFDKITDEIKAELTKSIKEQMDKLKPAEQKLFINVLRAIAEGVANSVLKDICFYILNILPSPPR